MVVLYYPEAIAFTYYLTILIISIVIIHYYCVFALNAIGYDIISHFTPVPEHKLIDNGV